MRVGTALWLAGTGSATAQPTNELLSAWIARTRKIDSLYVTGRMRLYRVRIGLEAFDRANWQTQPGVCPMSEFAIWLKRPDYRVELKRFENEQSTQFNEFHSNAWLDGKFGMLNRNMGEYRVHGAALFESNKMGIFWAEHHLTPLEYQFFDFPANDAVPAMAGLPHAAHGNVLSVDLVPGDTAGAPARWKGSVELDPQRGFLPVRASLVIELGGGRRSVEWEMRTLASREMNGVHVITAAQWNLYNPNILPNERFVHLWETDVFEFKPIGPNDLALVIPDGTPVTDYTSNWQWTAGSAAASQVVDVDLPGRIAESLQAQLAAPEIRKRRQGTMNWVVIGSLVVVGMLSLLAWRLRQNQQVSTRP